MEQVGLVISWIRISRSVCLSPICLLAEDREPPLAQDVQVDRRGFSHGEKDLLNVLNVQSLLRFPLPAAQHDVIDLLRTDPWPLQDTTLGDALDNLQRESNGVRRTALADWCLCFVRNGKAVTRGRLSSEDTANETTMKQLRTPFSTVSVKEQARSGFKYRCICTQGCQRYWAQGNNSANLFGRSVLFLWLLHLFTKLLRSFLYNTIIRIILSLNKNTASFKNIWGRPFWISPW